MRIARYLILAAALLACSPCAAAPPAAARSLSVQSAAPVEAELRRLAANARGVIGVAAWRLDGGDRVTLNGGERFPMASTFKIAVAGALLERVDKGELRLDQMVAVDPLSDGPSDGLAQGHLIHPGLSLSVANLLELMLTISDNNATDVLTRMAGGPGAVTGWVRRQGVADQRIDRDTTGILRDYFELGPGPFREAARAADPAKVPRVDMPNPAFDDDPRDTSTPEAMATLLARIFNGQALSSPSTAVLIETMQRCSTGDARLKGLLPAKTVVANKTGTIGGTVNDVGVIELPGGKGRFVVVVFIKKSDAPMADRERVIAEIGRTLRDYYLLTAG